MNKKIKATELSKESSYQRYSSKILPSYKPKPTLSLTPATLPEQRIKRKSTIFLKFIEQESEGGPEGDLKSSLKLLSQVIMSNKSVQRVFLLIYDNSIDQDLLRVVESLKKLKGLQKITVEMRNSNGITDIGFSCFVKRLARFCFLKSLSLNLFWSDEISDASLLSMGRMLKKLKLLKHLRLFFFDITHNDEGMSQVSGSLSPLTRLEDLTVKIRACPQITARSLAMVSSEKPDCLQKICLDFEDCTWLPDIGMFLISQDFTRMPNLHTLKLKFWDCPWLGDKGLKCLWKMLNNLPSLRRANLQFSASKNITDKTFDDMNKTLKCLHFIEKLSLEFFVCPKISDNGLVSLCKALEKGVSLKTLCVCFGGKSKITDFGVNEVIECLKKLTWVRKIGIDFSNKNITNTSLNKISQFLRSRRDLEKITLRITGMEGIADERKDDFVEMIDSLKIQKPDLKIKYRM